jgi:hypothetical protein
MIMNTGIRRPVLVVAILLAAAGYAATKEWEWQADADTMPLLHVAQIDRGAAGGSRDAGWRTDALTVQPEQIFQD